MAAISVIVPVYKVESYLCRCVDSILAQTFSDFELILVEDGSPDRCGVICDEYAKKDVRVHVIHQENGGLSVARNAGIDWVFANSNSEWITFVDSDDWIQPVYLEALYRAVQMHHVKISMCRFACTVEEVPGIENVAQDAVLVDVETAYTMNGKGVSSHAPARLYAKELLDGIRFPIGRVYEDVFTTHRICFTQGNMAIVEQKLYCYYHNLDGISNSENCLPKLRDRFDASEDQISFFGENGFRMAEKIRIRGYLQGISSLLAELEHDRKGNAEIIRLLEDKRKKNFCRYAKRLDIENETDAWVLTQVFPLQMKIYWHGKALAEKIKRAFSR